MIFYFFIQHKGMHVHIYVYNPYALQYLTDVITFKLVTVLEALSIHLHNFVCLHPMTNLHLHDRSTIIC